MVGNALEEGLLTHRDHPSRRDPFRAVALAFFVVWFAAVLGLRAVGLSVAWSFTLGAVLAGGVGWMLARRVQKRRDRQASAARAAHRLQHAMKER